MDGFSGVLEEKLPANFVMQRHRPTPMRKAHVHGHVEIILPIGCQLTYQTQIGPCVAPDNMISVLWGQIPHRVSHIDGNGEILIANLPLSDLLSWSMPEVFLAELFAGSLVVAKTADALDAGLFARWFDDYTGKDATLVAVARMELQLRLRRQSIRGWKTNTAPHQSQRTATQQSIRVQKMIRFMAENYRSPLTVQDIASHAGVSEGHAMGMFQRILNTSIKSYLTKLRLHHARASLANGNDKILSIALDAGFGSLSRFYEVFVSETGQTPRAFRQSQK